MKLKKSLGQNFLNDKNIVLKIIEAANVNSTDLVLEIGPGEGVLTEELAKKAKKVEAIEIDGSLIGMLNEKFNDQENVEILQGDILDFNLEKIEGTYKVIANIPYYITAPIIKKFLESKNPPSEMILMVQKEVAERIVAKPGKMSILAVSIQYYAIPEMLFNVEKEKFNPIPKVDSSVIKISNIQNKISKGKRKKFFQVVRSGFSAKRKTLVNNLSNSLHIPKEEAVNKLSKIEKSVNTRAQELSVKEWEKLADIL